MKKIGLLVLSLLLAVFCLGVAYASWSDMVSITGTGVTGANSGTLAVSLCWKEPAGQPDTDITCQEIINTSEIPPDPDQMVIDISRARPDVSYNCDFYVQNTGTIPSAVQSIEISNPASATLNVQVSGITPGQVIDPGTSITGTVSASLISEQGAGLDYEVKVRILVEQWNLYQSQ